MGRIGNGILGVIVHAGLAVAVCSAQVELYSENFDGAHGWTLNVASGTNGADNNFWTVDDDEGGVAPPGCSTADNADATLHVTNVFCPTCGAEYDKGGLCGITTCPETNMRAESPSFSTIGASGLYLYFDYIAGGQGTLDNASVLYNTGSGWTVVEASLKSTPLVCVGAQWTQAAIQLPAAVDNNSNVRIGFNWTNNDDGVGDDPSVAINNVRVVDVVAPPTETPTEAVTPAASATPTAAETAIATATDAPIASPTPTPAESEIPTPTPTPTTVPTEQALSEDSAGECSDGDDNDSDGAIDCADPDCAATSVCISVPAVSTTGSAMLLLTLLTLGGISIVRVRRQ